MAKRDPYADNEEKVYTKEDVDSARELEALHNTVKTLGEDLNKGFDNITSRLDKMNGVVQADSGKIIKLDSDFENHCKTHTDFEKGIRLQVGAYSVVGSVIGAMIAAAAAVLLWFKKAAGG